MSIFLAILLTVLTFTFVAYPLFRQRWAVIGPVEDEELRELNSRRNTTYSMLKELEFDYQSGILGDDDYRELEARYKGKAISILRDIDSLDKNTGIEEEIERQVQQLRQNTSQAKGRFCPNCGMEHEENARFCASCGANLTPGEKGD